MSKTKSKPSTASPSAAAMAATPSSIAGYLVLPVTLPTVLPSLPPATHYLYLRRHQPKLPTPDDERSLFVVNAPVDATEGHLRALFAGIGGGRVDSVRFEGDPAPVLSMPAVVPAAVPASGKDKAGSGKKRKRGDAGGEENEGGEGGNDPEERELPGVWDRVVHRSGGTAVVVFVDRASMEMAVRAVQKLAGGKAAGKKDGRGVTWGEKVSGDVPEMGMSRYLTHHALTFPSPSTLQSRIDAYMSHFSRLELLRAQALSRMRGQVDEDGFTLVVRGGRNAPVKQEEAQAALERKRKEEEEKRKRGGNVGFYRFQSREARKEEARRLVERVQVDRRRVEERKGRRKFRPL